MVTTIQISENLKKKLQIKKLYDQETYEEVIWDLLEDSMELSKETLAAIRSSENEIKTGKVHTLDQVKKELKL